MAMELEYDRLANTPSDINEHLPVLRTLAAECSSVGELGVRGVVSSWALALGLSESTSAGAKRLVCMDIADVGSTDRWQFFKRSLPEGVEATFVRGDSAKTPLGIPVDMLFIDTFHVYGHLRRELEFHASAVGKYIAMHDTQVDGVRGEAVRLGMDVQSLRWTTGYSYEDLTTGLQRAIDEFLHRHPEWQLLRAYDNNNGLTILKRK